MADTIYAGTGDGYAGRLDNTSNTWATIRAEAVSEALNTSDIDAVFYAIGRRIISKSGDRSTLYRALIPFNTGGTIPAGATIIDADLVLEQTHVIGGGSFQNCAVVQGAQPDETNIEIGDYNSFDALDNPDEGATRFSVSGLGTKTISLNTTGFRWIKRSGEASNGGGSPGWTKFMLRTGYYDVDNNQPSTTEKTYARFSSSTGANPPSLTVTWFPGPSGAIKLKGSQMRLKGSKVLIK